MPTDILCFAYPITFRIHFPEEPGVVQVETFGVSLNSSGTCFYGMQIEAVLDRIKDNISLDHLSRLLVDVQQDSSQIVSVEKGFCFGR